MSRESVPRSAPVNADTPRGELSTGGCRICGDEALTGVGEVEGYPFVECGHCGFTFAPSITPARMAALYGSGYHGPEDGAPVQGWANPEFLQPALERVRVDEPLDILDFGTGQSMIPAWLRDRGHRVVAADVVPPLHPHPDRLTGDLLELALPAASFDLVYAFQVLEHLPDPRRYLEELLRVTRSGGLVLLHTDMEVPEREEGFTAWWYVMPPDHCAFFCHRTFEVLLQDTPHEIAWRDEKSVILRVGQGADHPARSKSPV